MKINSQKGFTLIELLVVIAIVGILSSVVLASLNSARSKADVAYVKSTADQIKKELEMYYLQNGNYGIYTATNYYSQYRVAGYSGPIAGAGDCYNPFARGGEKINDMVGKAMLYTNDVAWGIKVFWCAVSPDRQSYAFAFEGMKAGQPTYCVDSSGNIIQSSFTLGVTQPITSIAINPITCK